MKCVVFFCCLAAALALVQQPLLTESSQNEDDYSKQLDDAFLVRNPTAQRATIRNLFLSLEFYYRNQLAAKKEELAAKKKELAAERDENKKLLIENVVSRNKILAAETYVLILRVRSRIEELERKFMKDKPRRMHRRDKWRKILNENITSSDLIKGRWPELQCFRDSVNDKDLLIEVICELYGDFSDTTPRSVFYPMKADKETVQGMFLNLAINPDDLKIQAVQLILSPIKSNRSLHNL